MPKKQQQAIYTLASTQEAGVFLDSVSSDIGTGLRGQDVLDSVKNEANGVKLPKRLEQILETADEKDHARVLDSVIMGVREFEASHGRQPTADVVDAAIQQGHAALNPDAKDDYGASAYLPDVAANLTESVTLVVNAAFTGVPTTSNAYGRGSDGRDQWPTSAVLACFVEGSTTYLAGDYDRAVDALRNTTDPFGYIISGGTQVLSLLAKLADFAIEANIPMKLDYSGNLDPDAVLTLDAALGLDTHYVHKYWAPLEAEDPASGGRAVWGASGLLAGYSCSRNARINAKGFAPKNYPVSGKPWPIVRTSTRQLHKPSEPQLSDLAKAQINPVIFELYNGGGRFVSTDCLTAAKTRVSYKKLITVAEMSATLDNWVAMYAKEILQQPMEAYIKSMKTYLQNLLEGAEASGWLKASENLQGNAAFAYTVEPDAVRKADVVHITYWTSFDGVARQGFITQTLTR